MHSPLQGFVRKGDKYVRLGNSCVVQLLPHECQEEFEGVLGDGLPNCHCAMQPHTTSSGQVRQSGH